MKKSTKLLSVILAVVMLFSSMSVLAFAQKAEYKTVQNLTDNKAYSPYGAVTRLSTEERMSMLFDYLDIVLGSLDNTSLDAKLFTINYGSVNDILKSIDTVTTNGAVKLVAGNKPDGKDLPARLTIENWQTGLTREGSDQLAIVSELLKLLSDNQYAVQLVIQQGRINLGTGLAILQGLIPDSINNLLSDLPGLLKGLIYPLFERKDDTTAQINTLLDTNNTVDSILTSFVKDLFTKPQSTTTYKEDAAGNCVSGHTLPTTADTRYYYVKNGNEFTCFAYDKNKGYHVEEVDHFIRTAELDADGKETGYYTYNKYINGVCADALKYYKDGSYWLPDLVASGNAASIMDISTNNGANMMYQMIPYVFDAMAPVVLNGSVKKLLGELFGASYNYVGKAKSAEVTALGSDAILTGDQGAYLWEWSDYAVLENGTHVYRFEDDVYVADLANVNPYFEKINWNYKITGDFMAEFIPGADGNTASAKGYTTLLQGLNDFLIKAAGAILDADLVKSMNLVGGDNSNLVENLKKAAQAFVKVSPESVFGDATDYVEYYDLMMSTNNQEVLLGIACTVVNLVMPQMILPTADQLTGKGYTVGSVLAAVIREIATQLVPNYNYDELIYDNYNNKTYLTGKDNSYWLDVCLTIGADIGMKYLNSLADLGADTEVGYKFAASKTYTAADFDPKGWEATVDWVIDWALSSQYEWCWSFEKLIDCGENVTVDLATTQDPWVKLGNILKSILPINQVLNVNTADSLWLETALRDNLVLGLLDLNVGKIVGDKNTAGLLMVPTSSVLRTQALLPMAVNVVRDLLNDVFYKVLGKANLVSESMVNGQIEQLFRSNTNQVQDNLAELAKTLLASLKIAFDNGLLVPVMPFLGFFVGWYTDAQKLVDPKITLATSAGKNYIHTTTDTASSTLKITNTAAGMLLTHRNSDKEDHNYVMVIDGISGDFTTDQTFPLEVLPFASEEFTVNTPYTADKSVTIDVHYHYKLKDSSEMPQNSLTATGYQFVSNKEPDVTGQKTYKDTDYRKEERHGLAGGKQWIIGALPSATNNYYVVDSAAAVSDLVNSMEFTITNTAHADAGASWVTAATMDSNPEWLTLRDSFIHDAATEPTSASSGYISKDPETDTLAPYLVKSDANLTAIYTGATFIDLGTFTLNWHNNVKAYRTGWAQNAYWEKTGGSNDLACPIDPGDIYVTDTAKLAETYNNYKSLLRSNFPKATDEQWAAMQTALLDAVAIVNRPFTIADFNAGVYNNNAALVKALEDAYAVLLASNSGSAVNEADVKPLKDALAAAEPGGDIPEINYQDYELYEYFEYQDERTETRNRIKAYVAPAAPEAKRIAGSSLTAAEIDALVAAETNATKAAAINATVTAPTQAELDAYQEASAAWTAPTYTALSNTDQAMKLGYYKQFLIPVTVNKNFLQKELDYVTAKNYDASLYSADSWAAYTAALDNAKAVNNDANALQSEVFNAKYELMRTQNALVLKTRSAKETGAYNNLNALIEKAEAIFAKPADYTVVEGMTADEAYKILIQALGYRYDGGVLYYHSAIDMVTYDRVITLNNQKDIAAAEAALTAAIANFKTLAVPELDLSDLGVTNGVFIDKASQSNDGAGFVYGINTDLGDSIADALATPAGSIRVTENEMGVMSTGAKIELLDDSGNVVETYYFIFFGDVNGDGWVDATDVTSVEGTASYSDFDYSAGDGSIMGMAADANGDGWIDATDITYLEGVASYSDFPTQAETAAAVAASKGI